MTQTATSSAPAGAATFEQSLKELEGIVRQLEGGNVDLEQAISDYERGMKLKAECEKRLEDAKLRVDKVVAAADGIKTEAFDQAE